MALVKMTGTARIRGLLYEKGKVVELDDEAAADAVASGVGVITTESPAVRTATAPAAAATRKAVRIGG